MHHMTRGYLLSLTRLPEIEEFNAWNQCAGKQVDQTRAARVWSSKQGVSTQGRYPYCSRRSAADDLQPTTTGTTLRPETCPKYIKTTKNQEQQLRKMGF